MFNPCEIAAQLGLEATGIINGTDVVYLRGNIEIDNVDAVKAGKPSRVFTQERLGMVHRPTDWIVKRSDLEDGGLYPPDEGDFIRLTMGRRIELYRVCRLPDEDGCSREHNGTGGAYIRIHSELYSEA